MKRLASILGAVLVANAITDTLFPSAGIRFMTEGPGASIGGPLRAMVRDVAGLSLGTRRFLAAWELTLGLLVLWLSLAETR